MKVSLFSQYNFARTAQMQSKPAFGRELSEEDKPKCEADSKEALHLLGVKNLSLILHGSCFPADKRDFYVGSFFNKRAKDVYDMTRMFGFNSTQLGPNGLIKTEDVSPYGGNAFSNNYLFIDLNRLATDEYANILNERILNIAENKHEFGDQTDFVKAFASYDIMLNAAYRNLNKKAELGNGKAIELKNEFSEYKQRKDWLENDALYAIMKKRTYKNKPREEWDEIDKNLIKYCNEGNEEALERKSQLLSQYKFLIDVYKFKQFIYDKQLGEFVKENGGKVDFIADALVGFSDSDVWANPDAFLEGYCLGAPDGGAHGSHQIWNLPVIDPKKLFNEDGTLGAGGKLIRAKFERLLEDAKAVRIDHAIGLVDPWIYKKSSVETVLGDDGKVYQKWAKQCSNISHNQELDPEHAYGRIIEDILFPLMDEKNIDRNTVVWEDIGSQTHYFRQIYHEKLHLPGIQTLRAARAEDIVKKDDKGNDIKSEDWWLFGSHDNRPASLDIDDCLKGNRALDPLYLAGYLYYPKWSDEKRAALVSQIQSDPRERLKYKMVEMLAKGKNVQVSFMDLFGLNKVYNHVGTTDERNWKLRLTPQFEKDYYKTLEERRKDKIALNMPEILAKALESKLAAQKEENVNAVEQQKTKRLIMRLKHYAKVLYEKDDKS